VLLCDYCSIQLKKPIVTIQFMAEARGWDATDDDDDDDCINGNCLGLVYSCYFSDQLIINYCMCCLWQA